jgi:hypothetical protein
LPDLSGLCFLREALSSKGPGIVYGGCSLESLASATASELFLADPVLNARVIVRASPSSPGVA